MHSMAMLRDLGQNGDGDMIKHERWKLAVESLREYYGGGGSRGFSKIMGGRWSES